MSFEVIASKRVKKEIEKFEKPLKIKLLDLFLKLKENPVPVDEFDVVKLSGSLNAYRVRIQKIRVIYDIFWKQKRIELLKVEKRKDRTYK
ncbi:MAG TPA: type II toxin-antitoxin system RelE/ParE family toxin [archaeon]|nr:type II toxin-antitoxin system RelE/ParE family toxin [archaeon]